MKNKLNKYFLKRKINKQSVFYICEYVTNFCTGVTLHDTILIGEISRDFLHLFFFICFFILFAGLFGYWVFMNTELYSIMILNRMTMSIWSPRWTSADSNRATFSSPNAQTGRRHLENPMSICDVILVCFLVIQ